MPRLTTKDQLKAYRDEQVELAKKIKATEKRVRDKFRADEERRERLAGRAMLDAMAAHPDSGVGRALLLLLADKVRRPADRKLFPGLPPLPKGDDSGAR